MSITPSKSIESILSILSIPPCGRRSSKRLSLFALVGCVAAFAQAGVQITAEPPHLILPDDAPGGEIVFRAEIDGKPMARTRLTAHAVHQQDAVDPSTLRAGLDGNPVFPGTSKVHTSTLYTGFDGKAVLKFSASPAPQSVIAAIPGLAAAEACVETVPAEEWNRNAEIAKKISLKQNLRILFIGDSLSDFSRGRNYADQLNFWLNLHNSGKASFRNAGVGGDYIIRVLERLKGTADGRAAYRQEMYSGIAGEKPDLVFIFLGHNDTRAKSTDNFSIPLVAPEAQEEAYREAIAFIREKIGGKIVLVSASSSNYQVCRESIEKRLKAAPDKLHVRFGDPQMLEAFNDVLKRLAAEFKLDYVDIYRPMASLPEKASLLYPADGVHLTEKGHRFVAAELLKYIAEQK